MVTEDNKFNRVFGWSRKEYAKKKKELHENLGRKKW